MDHVDAQRTAWASFSRYPPKSRSCRSASLVSQYGSSSSAPSRLDLLAVMALVLLLYLQVMSICSRLLCSTISSTVPRLASTALVGRARDEIESTISDESHRTWSLLRNRGTV